MASESKKRICSEPEPGACKKPYARPVLTIHGDVLEITKALDIGGTDGQSGSQQGDLGEG